MRRERFWSVGAATVAASLAISGGTAVAGPAPGAPGALDPGFGVPDRASRTRGLAVSIPGVALRGVAVQPDGRILAVGRTEGGPSLVVARFTADGRPDPSFGTGGVARLPAVAGPDGNAGSAGTGIALQPDGRIVVSGSLLQSGAPAGLLAARLLPSGAPDPSFSGDGVAVALEGGAREASAEAVAVAPGGKIVVAGRARDNRSTPRVALARLQPDGSLDPGFRGGGADLMGEVGFQGADASGVAVRPDGRIVLAGAIMPDIYNTTQGLIVQTDATGRLDGSFAGGGQTVLALSRNAAYSRFNALALAADGGIIAAGAGARANVGDGVVVRLLGNGAVDPAFGTAGRAYLAAGEDTAVVGTEPYPGYFAVLAAPGRVYAGGGVDAAGPFRFSALSALTTSGAPERGFGAPIDPAYSSAVRFTAPEGTTYAFADEAGGRPFQGDAAQITGLARTPGGDVAAVGNVGNGIGGRGSTGRAVTGFVAVYRGLPDPIPPAPAPVVPTPTTPTQPTPTVPGPPTATPTAPAPPTVPAAPPAPVTPPTATPPSAVTPPPRLTRTALRPRVLSAGRTARLSFTTSAAGTVTLSVVERRTGRVRNGQCRAATAATRQSKSCSYEVGLSGIRKIRVGAGARTIRLSRRVAGRTLRRGSYRLVVTVTSRGVPSKPRTLTFRVR